MHRNVFFSFREKLGWRLPIYIIFFSLLMVACANIGSPDGGPYDEDPPKIVRTTPKYGSIAPNVKKIVLEFNEQVKIDNASENVIVSPPQIEQPEIEASGKKITIKLIDSIKPNTTYTIDFADAIQDNNEGNAMGDYAFTFSTGGDIDTMQVSGNVLDASNLEPIKGIYVGVYQLADSAAEFPDSVFRTKSLERVSRTDANGHFAIKGMKKAYYRVFALQDQNQNFKYDQKSEMLAFSDRRFTPSCKADIKADTVWHDSIHYDSINYRGYTHFYPDDLTLTAFTAATQDRNLLKCERPQLNMFTIMFTAGADTLPKLRGLNFDTKDAFVIDASEKNDTINYWIRDSLIYNIDTLSLALNYYQNDSVGLVLTCDTFNLVSKISKAKMAKELQKKQDDWAKEYRKEYRAELRAKEHEQENAGSDGNKPDDEDGMKEDGAATDAPKDDVSKDDAPKDGVSKTEGPDDGIPIEDSLKTDVPKLDISKLDIPETDMSKEETPKDKVSKKGTSKKDASKKDPSKADDKKSNDKKSKKSSKLKDEDIVVPPMPEELLESNVKPSNLDPDDNIDISFSEPVDSVDLTKLKFYTKKDSTQIPEKYVFEKVEGKIMNYRLYASWQPDSTYFLECDTGMFVSIYGKRSAPIKKTLKVGGLDTYSTLYVTLQNADTSSVVQLIDAQDKVVKTVKNENGKADFYFLKPGIYYMRLFYDHNSNGIWDTGDYDLHQQAEEVYYYPSPMELKAQWEINQTFNPTSTPLAEQKPLAITKQKDAKKDKTKLSKNQQRLKDKQEGKNGKTDKSSSNISANSLKF